MEKKDKIPQWAKWIAKDENGAIWLFEAEPHLHDTGWYENEVGRYQQYSGIYPIFDDLNWRLCLAKL